MQHRQQPETFGQQDPQRRSPFVSPDESGQPKPERRVSHCANCDIDFVWQPTIAHNHVFCCNGCAAGGPCNCDYSLYRSITILGVIYYEE
jgi:hypothetical protein